jgi:hypothetical protein
MYLISSSAVGSSNSPTEVGLSWTGGVYSITFVSGTFAGVYGVVEVAVD